MRMIVAMLPTILLVVYGQLVTKWRIEAISASLPESDRWARLFHYLSDPVILSAYAAALGGSVAWMFVVERFDLSIAFPVYVGLTIATVALAGVWVFGETLSWQRGLSIVLILAGVALGSRG